MANDVEKDVGEVSRSRRVFGAGNNRASSFRLRFSRTMATGSSSAPSSSAVPIPRPGKSILKPPAPPPRPLFSLSTLSKLLPSQQEPATNGSANGSLKRAHFIMPQLVTVYPISSANPPSMPGIKEEKKAAEEKERERRRRVMRGNSFTTPVGTPISELPPADDWWTADKLASFYNEVCAGREELPNQFIVAALRAATQAKPRSLDLTGIPLTLDGTYIVTDLLNVEWGLRKLVLKNCDLDDQVSGPSSSVPVQNSDWHSSRSNHCFTRCSYRGLSRSSPSPTTNGSNRPGLDSLARLSRR